MFKVVMIGSEWRGIKKQSYFRRVLDILAKKWRPMLILAPCQGRRGLIKIKEGVWYYCFPSFFNYFLFALSRHKIKTKLLLAQDPFWYGIIAFLVKHHESKIILELHSQYFFNKKWLSYRLRNMFYYIIGRYLLKKANYIRTVYPDKKLVKMYGKKVLYIPSNYTDISLFKPSFSRKTYDVIFVGRLHPQKNINYLVKIFNELKRLGYKCVVIGKGSKKYELMIRNIGCDYLGYVDNVDKIYRKAKVLIIVSHDEGGPRVAYEALASGCLVATTSTGKIIEDINKHKLCGEILTEELNKDVEIIKKLVREYSLRASKCSKNIRKELNFGKAVYRYAQNIEKLIKN